MKEGQPLPVVRKVVTQERIDRYAAASGDHNPIHVDRELAASLQFGGTIAHGMMVAAQISEVMTLAFTEHWIKAGRLKLRFRSPVRPGDTVTTFGEVVSVREGGESREVRCAVGVRKQDGEAAITGVATVTIMITTGGDR